MAILGKIALTAAVAFFVSLVLVGVGCHAYDYHDCSSLHNRYKRIGRCGIYGMAASAITLLVCLLIFIWTQ